jgi:predicted amino acid-binding ACT domain protein
VTPYFGARLRQSRSRRQFLAALLAAGLSLVPALQALAQDTFTLAIIPDTQQEVLRADDTRLKNRFQWLVDHQKELNIKIALQTGDFMNWDTPDHIQYERASEALTILDKAGLPYALAIGNHDSAATKEGGSAAPGNVNTNLRNTSTFNRYFPVSRQKQLQGFYEASKVDNAYQTFTAGGLNWLVINMELWPRAGAVDWARSVAEKHPNHNVILITHSYLTGNSMIEQRNGGYGDNSPQFMFDKLVSVCPNIRLIFAGHVGSHGYRTDKGTQGNTIYSFLTTYHSNTDNPVRLLTIDTKKGTMTTHVFCPSTGKDREDGSTRTITDVEWVKPR